MKTEKNKENGKNLDENGNILVTYLFKRGVEIKRDGYKIK